MHKEAPCITGPPGARRGTGGNCARIERKVGGNVKNGALKYWTGSDGARIFTLYIISGTQYIIMGK